ncbi:hypothetical protein SLEP1_g16614 [Rubroshorea leprosula]|uniref:Uncharacterized protein n=1 Tax=Rubroshorea leprosula TaxID=152421 RepID=A0AAV5IRF4_9ROSI|nr:hypothetical protein SLEP1_g16614 [Rubroshorea leprosula]
MMTFGIWREGRGEPHPAAKPMAYANWLFILNLNGLSSMVLGIQMLCC